MLLLLPALSCCTKGPSITSPRSPARRMMVRPSTRHVWSSTDNNATTTTTAATTATAPVIHLIDRTAADASHPVALATPLNPAFPRMPTTSIRSGIAPSAYLAEPEHPFSPLIRRQNLRYDVSRSEVPSQDDFYGIPRDSYSYHNTRFAKGKGKGKLPKGRGTRNANPKD